MDPGGVQETRDTPGRAQDVGHARTSTGAEFGENERALSTLIDPGLRQRQADDLTVHLADFGRGGEIPRDAERVSFHVVSMLGVQQALRHVFGDSDWTGRRDPIGKQSHQWGH